MIGREEVWLPRRWRNLRFEGDKRERFMARLVKVIRRLERWSRPRGRVLFGRRTTNTAFGALVLAGTVAAFVAPPFSMLDTLPALGVVVLSLGVLLDDAVVAAAGVAIGAGGIALVVVVGRAALRGIEDLVGLTAAPLLGCVLPITGRVIRERGAETGVGGGAPTAAALLAASNSLGWISAKPRERASQWTPACARPAQRRNRAPAARTRRPRAPSRSRGIRAVRCCGSG
jgi:exopolysaccharide synthesis protein ExoD